MSLQKKPLHGERSFILTKNKTSQEIPFTKSRWRSAYRIIERLSKSIETQEKRLARQEENIKVMGEQFYDQLKEMERERDEAIARANTATRNYNALHGLGKFAEREDIDLLNTSLPESAKNKYDFSQKAIVLESGKSKHEYFLKTKKKG